MNLDDGPLLADPLSGIFSPKHRSLTIGLVSIVTLVAFESLAVITILPDIEADLRGLTWYGWVTTAFFLGTMIGIVFAGGQADRHGLGRPYVIGLIIFAVGLVVSGLAPSMPALVVGRFVQGFGAGVVPAIGYVAIGRVYPVGVRPRMFAVMSTAWVVPGLVGPVLAERVSAGVGWRAVFLGLLPFVALAGVLIIPEMMRLRAPAALEQADAEPSVPWSRQPMLEAVRVAVGAAVVVASLTTTAWLIAAGVGDRDAPRSRAAPAPHTTGDTARRGGAACRGLVTRSADVRVLRHRHVRATRRHRWPRRLHVRGQHRRHRRNVGLDHRDVDPAALHHPHRRSVVRTRRLRHDDTGHPRRRRGFGERRAPVLDDPRRVDARRSRHGTRLLRALPAHAALLAGRASTAPPRQPSSCPTTSESHSVPASPGRSSASLTTLVGTPGSAWRSPSHPAPSSPRSA